MRPITQVYRITPFGTLERLHAKRISEKFVWLADGRKCRLHTGHVFYSESKGAALEWQRKKLHEKRKELLKEVDGITKKIDSIDTRIKDWRN